MSKINVEDLENEIIPRWQKILEHAQATVNLFNNTPYIIKKDFRHHLYFIIFEALDKKGELRVLSYSCFSESEQSKIADKLAEHFDIDIEEITE